MPRYFFNIQDGRDIPDTEGIVLADADAARVEAVAALGDLIKGRAKTFWKSGDWQIQVTDEQGASVCDVYLSGTVGAH